MEEKNKMKKILTILISVMLVMVGVVSATDGDVTIVVNNQTGVPIEGATASLLFYGGGKGGYSMPSMTTDEIGSATFTASEIATWLAANGYSPVAGQINIQPGAKVVTDTAYGKVRTVRAIDGFPVIPYSIMGGTLVVGAAMDFDYNMLMMSKEPVQTTWDDDANTFAVTATLAESISVSYNEMRLRLIRNIVSPQVPSTNPDDRWYFSGVEWIGIGTEDATNAGLSLSATFSQDILSDWVDGNKAIVRPEIWIERDVDGTATVDDYYAADITLSSSYIDYPRTESNVEGEGADFVALSVPDSINYGTLYSFDGFKSQVESIDLVNVGSLDVTVTPIWANGAEVFKYINFDDTVASGVIDSFSTTIDMAVTSGEGVFPVVFSNTKPLTTWIKLITGTDLAKLEGPQTGTIYFSAVEA